MKRPSRYPVASCATCGAKVYTGRAPNTCMVALCGRPLVEPRKRPARDCLRIWQGRLFYRLIGDLVARYDAIRSAHPLREVYRAAAHRRRATIEARQGEARP